MRQQDAQTARPRPPTVGEARARQKAIRQQEEFEQARLAAETHRQTRNRRLIGGAAVVGVVGVVAGLGYWALSPRHVTAQCVRDDTGGQPIIVPDSYCGGSSGLNGFIFLGGHQYRYYYGSSGGIGSSPVGGTTIAPKGATISTPSGTTIQRGGLGSRMGGSGS